MKQPDSYMRKTILVVGAGGQIGTELVPHLQSVYGDDHVIAAELRPEVCRALSERSRTECLNALDREAYATIMNKYRPDWVFNLVAVLSATGEKNPQTAWHQWALCSTRNGRGCGFTVPSGREESAKRTTGYG